MESVADLDDRYSYQTEADQHEDDSGDDHTPLVGIGCYAVLDEEVSDDTADDAEDEC